MKKYHVATGDGKGYYGVNYESYREATELLKISQRHDPQAHIIEEEYHFTNADRIRSMSDEELAKFLAENEWECETYNDCAKCPRLTDDGCVSLSKWLKQPTEGE